MKELPSKYQVGDTVVMLGSDAEWAIISITFTQNKTFYNLLNIDSMEDSAEAVVERGVEEDAILY